MNPSVKDYLLTSTVVLPVGAVTTTGTAIDLGQTTRGQHLAQCELLIEAPALTVGALPDTKTITYDIISSASSNMSSPTVLVAGLIVQTGAGGVGAAAATARYRPATNVAQYVAIRATGVATVSAASFSTTAALVF